MSLLLRCRFQSHRSCKRHIDPLWTPLRIVPKVGHSFPSFLCLVLFCRCYLIILMSDTEPASRDAKNIRARAFIFFNPLCKILDTAASFTDVRSRDESEIPSARDVQCSLTTATPSSPSNSDVKPIPSSLPRRPSPLSTSITGPKGGLKPSTSSPALKPLSSPFAQPFFSRQVVWQCAMQGRMEGLEYLRTRSYRQTKNHSNDFALTF